MPLSLGNAHITQTRTGLACLINALDVGLCLLLHWSLSPVYNDGKSHLSDPLFFQGGEDNERGLAGRSGL